jgi:exopolysaccharide biosynthesis protein
MKNKSVILLILLVVFIIIVYLLLIPKENLKTQIIKTENEDLEINFRNILEKQYLEFKDFENQNSFAGKKVKMEIYEGERYYVYMILGSGVPIVEATCFKVDNIGRTFKIGIFPDPTSSYIGYNDINPVNCRGIK